MLFINRTSCLLQLHTHLQILSLDLAFQTSSFSYNALHLAVMETEGAAWSVKAGVVHQALWDGLSSRSQNAPVLQQHAGAWGVSRDDLFPVLLVNLQRDSGRSGGHPSACSGLQAIRAAMRSTNELCMELSWGRLPLHQHNHSSSGTTGRGASSIPYILYVASHQCWYRTVC